MKFRLIVSALALVLLGLQYRLWFGEPDLQALWQLEDQIETQQDENQTLTGRNLELEAEVEDLKDGFSALEERARSELGMVKKGETFYQLVDPPGRDQTPQAEP